MKYLRLQSVVTGGINDGNHTHNTTIAFDPAPREGCGGYPFAGHFVNIATNAITLYSARQAIARRLA